VAQVAHRYEGKVAFIGIAGRDDVGPMQDFVRRYDLGFFAHAADTDGGLWAKLGVSGQPAWIFVDRAGHARLSYGALSEPQLERALDEISS